MRETIGPICKTLIVLLIGVALSSPLPGQEKQTPPPTSVQKKTRRADQQEKDNDKSKPSEKTDVEKVQPSKDQTNKKVKPSEENPNKGVSNVDRTHILNDLTFDNLKFEMDKGEDFRRSLLTKKIEGYHGTTVRIRGYIQPGTKQSGLTRFIFVRDNQECCFGAQAAIYDNILVKLNPAKPANFTVRPITIEGKFALKEYIGPNRKVWSLYRMYDAEVK